MKPSAFDTFCRALVLGAVLGALGWGAVRYTDLPQMVLQKMVAISQEAQGHALSENYLSDSSVLSASTPAPPLCCESARRSTKYPQCHARYLATLSATLSTTPDPTRRTTSRIFRANGHQPKYFSTLFPSRKYSNGHRTTPL